MKSFNVLLLIYKPLSTVGLSMTENKLRKIS